MTTFPLKLYSKSSVERDWKCPRSYYWAYEYDGKGINPDSRGIELFLGTALHDGLAALAAEVDIDDIADAAWKQVFSGIVPDSGAVVSADTQTYAREQACMIEGILRGFHKHIWPKLMAEYDIFLVEEPLIYRHGKNLGMMSKADLVLRSKSTGGLWYFEYKSTSSKKPEWIKSWNTAVQVHSSVKAIEQAYPDEQVEGVIIQGLYKGYQSYGRQNSPFCYGYIKYGQPPFTKDQIAYEYRSGWKKTPVWELDGGVKKWVEEMPEEVIVDQFPQTPPIPVDDDLIEAFFAQQDVRQTAIEVGKEICANGGVDGYSTYMLNTLFPQRFDQCLPAWGYECSYRPLCFGREMDPLVNGFSYRDVDHLKPFMDKTQ
jgi:hypothetical protein